MTGAIGRPARGPARADRSTRARPASSCKARWSPPTARSSASTANWCEKLPGLIDKLDTHADQAGLGRRQRQRACSARTARAITSFANDGLAQVGPTLAELRALVRDLRRVSDRLDGNPAGYVLGRDAPEGVRTRNEHRHATRLHRRRVAARSPAARRRCWPAARILRGKQATARRSMRPRRACSADPAWPTVTWQLPVPRPHAARMVDSPRIAVRPTPGELQVYKGAQLGQAAPATCSQDARAARASRTPAGSPPSPARAAASPPTTSWCWTCAASSPTTPAAPVPAATIEVSAKLLHAQRPAASSPRARSCRPAPRAAHRRRRGGARVRPGAGRDQPATIVGWTLAERRRARSAASAHRSALSRWPAPLASARITRSARSGGTSG